MIKLPIVTKSILMINVLMFLGTLVAQKYGLDLNRFFSLHFFLSSDFNFAQVFTYMFMHANIAHIFFNMFAVWMFGSVLERFFGASKYLMFYVVCGIGAAIVQEAVAACQYFTLAAEMPAQMVQTVMADGAAIMHQGMNYIDPMMSDLNRVLNTPTLGASGAVFGILLGFGMRFPNERIFIFPLPFPIKAKWFVIGYAIIELFLGVSNNARDNVAHFAHLGGMLFGLVMILWWKKRREW